ncbi:MAG: alpha/beta hydrolase [Prevotella sp.]|jgi:pimeloyl-ACP methyl ester carboxylesterase|nr:alpha/beta hydrolase [Prevotella sp.]
MKKYISRFCILVTIFLSHNQPIMAQGMGNKHVNYLQNNGSKTCYRDTGSGSATIVLVSGATMGLETWGSFQEQLSEYARVISYDRSGLGNSDYIPSSKNIGSMTAELEMIINTLDVNTSVILVGHSIGGYIVRKYAELYPQKVKVLFLIDAYHELFYKELKAAVTEEMWNDYIGNWQNIIAQVPPGAADEIGFNLELMKSDEKYPIPSDIPVYLFTSIKEVEIEERFVEFNKIAFGVHLRLNKQLENDHKNLRHIITDKSSHFIYLDEPDLITNEILKTIDN